MKAALVIEAGKPPVYGEFRQPVAAAGQHLVRVTASSLSHVTRSRASGSHYSAQGALPFIPGIDGVGTLADGTRVYFLLPESPFGGMAELCVVSEAHLFALPDDITSEAAAAMAIPGMSSWAALVERARLRDGETVLVNGGTGTSGRLAIQIAKHLGARRVVATGRNVASLEALHALGADATIALTQEPEALERALQREFEQGIDIVLDYLWGSSAQTLLVAAARGGADGVPIRFVQIGSISGADISLPSAVLRSSSLVMMGSGIGSVGFPEMLGSIRGVLQAAPAAGFAVATSVMPLADVAVAWASNDRSGRIVLVP